MGINNCCGKASKDEEDKKDVIPEAEKQGEKFDYDEWEPSWQTEIDGEELHKPWIIGAEVKDKLNDELPIEYQDGYTIVHNTVEEFKEANPIPFANELYEVAENVKEKRVMDISKLICQTSVVNISYINRKK